MPSQVESKKKAIIAQWQRIIIDGEGFGGLQKHDLSHGLEVYLKGRCSLKTIDNFAVFCRQWCKEILPQLDIVNESQIERIYVIFKTLGKESVEADTYGVRDCISLENYVYTYIQKVTDLSNVCSFSSLFSFGMDQLSSICKTFPWWIYAIRSSLTRYRTVRQAHIGCEIVSATLKERHTNLATEIENKFCLFNDLQMNVASSFSKDGIIKKDHEKTCREIKEISTKRLAMLSFRVFVASCCLFVCLWGAVSESVMVKILCMCVFVPVYTYGAYNFILNHWQGALQGGSIGFLEIVFKLVYSGGLPLIICELFMALMSGHPLWIVFYGLVCLADILFCIVINLQVEHTDQEIHNNFYNAAPWDEVNDPMRFVLSPSSKLINYMLDKVLTLIDGNSSAVNLE